MLFVMKDFIFCRRLFLHYYLKLTSECFPFYSILLKPKTHNFMKLKKYIVIDCMANETTSDLQR